MRNNRLGSSKSHRQFSRRICAIVMALSVMTGIEFSALSSVYASSESQEHHAEKPEKHKKNHVSLLLAGTTVPDANHTGFTLGIDLEHEITHRFGVGLVVEHAFDPVDATSVFGVIDVHLGQGFVLQVGPGVEWVDDETLFVGRIGLFYEIELGEIVIAPSISYDLSEAEDSIVFGTAIGTKF